MSDVPLLTIAEELAQDRSKCRNMIVYGKNLREKSRFSHSNSEQSDSLCVDICQESSPEPPNRHMIIVNQLKRKAVSNQLSFTEKKRPLASAKVSSKNVLLRAVSHRP